MQYNKPYIMTTMHGIGFFYHIILAILHVTGENGIRLISKCCGMMQL